jgi:hypothetical protein
VGIGLRGENPLCVKPGFINLTELGVYHLSIKLLIVLDGKVYYKVHQILGVLYIYNGKATVFGLDMV